MRPVVLRVGAGVLFEALECGDCGQMFARDEFGKLQSLASFGGYDFPLKRNGPLVVAEGS